MKAFEGDHRVSRSRVLVSRLTLLLLLVIPSAILLTRQSVPPAGSNPILVASNSPTAVKALTIRWYFRNNQWSADIRTLASMLHYIADSPELAQTNSLNAKSKDA
jgi:hypothetical protein